MIFSFALLFFAHPACAAACSSAASTAGPRWTIDHYLYDASLRRDWEILIDCNHPQLPARMTLANQLPTSHRTPALPTIKAGASVEITGTANDPGSICLTGTAIENAFTGQTVRVRLDANGHFVMGRVRGSHLVELIAAARPLWGTP